MLGIGPLIWRHFNREFYGSSSDPEPVHRDEAWVIADAFALTPRYRYEYPAAWHYYQWLDKFNEHSANPTSGQADG